MDGWNGVTQDMSLARTKVDSKTCRRIERQAVREAQVMCPPRHHAVAGRKHTRSSIGEQDGVSALPKKKSKNERLTPMRGASRQQRALCRAQYNDDRELFAQRQDEMTATLSEILILLEAVTLPPRRQLSCRAVSGRLRRCVKNRSVLNRTAQGHWSFIIPPLVTSKQMRSTPPMKM